MTGDKIIAYLFGLNALINVILIARSERRYKSDRENVVYGSNFWQVYLYLVPFFVTNSIIKEIENKREKQLNKMNLLAKDYEGFIDSWKIAASDLNIRIQAPFMLKLNDKDELKCPILVEQFGSKLGTIIFSVNDKLDINLLKKSGYYCYAVNPSLYSTYKRDLFIDTLIDFRFCGDPSNKPDWYKGEAWNG
jgi:hypothetical protein